MAKRALPLGLLIAALAAGGCSILPRTDFGQGPRIEFDKQIVLINRHCETNPDIALLDYDPTFGGKHRREVIWVVDKSDEEEATISVKSAEKQDDKNRERGDKIRRLLGKTDFVLEPGVDAVSSGIPKYKPPYDGSKGVLVLYGVTIRNPQTNETVCSSDPGLCYRTTDGGYICTRR